IRLTVASADEIRAASHGEVMAPETVHPRSGRPVPRGLFCEHIFGIADCWECRCGWRRGEAEAGVECERCGEPVAPHRQPRFGPVGLASPGLHRWFLAPLARLLGFTQQELLRIAYYRDFVVVRPGETTLRRGQLLAEDELRRAYEEFGRDTFETALGAEACR